MGKDIYFRDSKEKAVSRQDRRADKDFTRQKMADR